MVIEEVLCMRTNFNEELEELRRSVIQMGKSCRESIRSTCGLLSSRNKEELDEICEKSVKISNMESLIETLCNRLLLLQQPVATDLRQVSGSLKIAADLERIAINGGDIAEILLTGETDRPCQLLLDIAGASIEMLDKGLEALENSDTALARQVIDMDDKVDELFVKFRNELTQGLLKEGSLVDQLMIGKYYERIADHVVNVAGWVIYIAEGKQVLSQK